MYSNRAAIHQVLQSLAMNTSVDHGRDLLIDAIRNVQPVELSVHEMMRRVRPRSNFLVPLTTRAAASAGVCQLDTLAHPQG